jgi:hypothetical protein
MLYRTPGDHVVKRYEECGEIGGYPFAHFRPENVSTRSALLE